jgi:NAD(P)-dependent dehydrogenase (short-subunit alcohol dehydrogenase family)
MRKTTNYFDLNKCSTLIAGGATGLGFEMAKGLLSVGCDVTIIGRTEERVKKSADILNEEYDSTCSGLKCDISDEKSLSNILERFSIENSGKLNVAINSAGFNIRNKIEDISLDEWESIQKVNSTGAFLFAKGVFPLLKNADFGRLINVASIFSQVSFPERVSYSSSKGSVLQLTKTLALEWADSRITVNSISPGPFLTDINKPVLDNPENYKKFCFNIPKGRFGNPEEIVTACLFLSSPFSSYVNGSDIVVDGGWLSC